MQPGYRPGSDGIFGLQFENLILKTRPALWAHLGLRAEDIVFDNPLLANSHPANPRLPARLRDPVSQQHRLRPVSQVQQGAYARAVVTEVDAKIRALGKPRNFTFRPILIHVNGVDDAVGEAGYFDAIIDFGELW